jgi:outer membrane lipopolysaccharide assembly protein LptE/RlpB
LVLSIASEQLERRPVSVNARARAAQYELTLVSVVSLSVGNTLLLDSEDISESSEYFEEIENLAGTQDETLLLTQEMRSRLVQQIIRRVSAALP